MSRCWGCCQENCGNTNCRCSCHRDEVQRLPAEPTKKAKRPPSPIKVNKSALFQVACRVVALACAKWLGNPTSKNYDKMTAAVRRYNRLLAK